jgi:hypothetical protein
VKYSLLHQQQHSGFSVRRDRFPLASDLNQTRRRFARVLLILDRSARRGSGPLLLTNPRARLGLFPGVPFHRSPLWEIARWERWTTLLSLLPTVKAVVLSCDPLWDRRLSGRHGRNGAGVATETKGDFLRTWNVVFGMLGQFQRTWNCGDASPVCSDNRSNAPPGVVRCPACILGIQMDTNACDL